MMDFDFDKNILVSTKTIVIIGCIYVLFVACMNKMHGAPWIFFILFCLAILYFFKDNALTPNSLKELLHEGFHTAEDQVQIPDKSSFKKVLDNEFKEGTKTNPFSNVLLTQIMDDPEREAAPPAFNETVQHDINKEVKKAVQMLNPTILNTNKQLFGDLWQNFVLDQSNRVFYSTANTRVTNDQGAYAKFLYDNMKYSGKESTPEGAFARIQDNYRYTLY